MFEVGKNLDRPGRMQVAEPAGGELVVIVGVHVQGEADLLQVVLTLRARGRLAHFLNRGQEQTDQNRDDRDDHQQLDQGEAIAATRPFSHALSSARPRGELVCVCFHDALREEGGVGMNPVDLA